MGIPGVGKTTVVEKAAGILGARVVTFGTVMFEEAFRLGWVKGRDEMRRMPVEKQRRLQNLAASEISRSKDSVLFVDTHLFIRTTEGMWPGLPFDVVRAMKPTHLVLVEATPKEIMARRASDKTRTRDVLSVGTLASELALGRAFLVSASAATGAPVLLLMNRAGKADAVAGQLAAAVAGIRPPTRVAPDTKR